jgi:NAD(P)-dependent dehydrogenase (short-subunit alcohol dehydrogenase family)
MTVRLGLEGRGALVTGATSDVGEACVKRLCHEGAKVVCTGADATSGESLAANAGANFIQFDQNSRDNFGHLVTRAMKQAGGRLDVLVTNAENRPQGSIEGTSEADFRHLVEANLTAVFLVARACWEPMRSGGGGSMILVASDAGVRAAHETAAYSVTSAGVIAVAELLAAEGVPHGIRSNAVCPGGQRGATASSPGVGGGTDVAALVAWLASDESTHVNGATLRIDGGAGAAMVAETRG